MNEGKVIQVAGPAVDVEFPEGHIPVIRTADRASSAKGSTYRTRSTSSAKWRSTSVKAACVRSRCSRPTVWCAA